MSESEAITWPEFLESTPPNISKRIKDLTVPGTYASATRIYLTPAEPHLYCPSEHCQGLRYFHLQGNNIELLYTTGTDRLLDYVCRNCSKTLKTFAVRIQVDSSSSPGSGSAVKLGEIPPYGPHVPARVITLVGPDRELFLKGRRAESLGLGVGAFAYYRQVVENQKGRFISEIARVAGRLGAPPEDVDTIKRAATETQFSKAIDEIKDAIPQALRINGQNPLLLLHTALSQGLHEGTDEECLQDATDVRMVLTELSDRIGQALTDQNELNASVGRLVKKIQGTK